MALKCMFGLDRQSGSEAYGGALASTYPCRDEIARCEAIIRERARTLLAGPPAPAGAAPQLAHGLR